MFISQPAKFLMKFQAKVVVSAFTLDRLYNDCSNFILKLLKMFFCLCYSLLL
jgi:hypothetical protein